nr:hypothetical protein JVH1_3951 [Rhodococcus sp. JVH1]
MLVDGRKTTDADGGAVGAARCRRMGPRDGARLARSRFSI